MLRRDRGLAELLEAIDERAAEAVNAIAIRCNGPSLAMIEVLADLFGRVDTMVQVGDEGGDRLLKVDVVFPERIVGIEQERLVGVSGNIRMDRQRTHAPILMARECGGDGHRPRCVWKQLEDKKQRDPLLERVSLGSRLAIDIRRRFERRVAPVLGGCFCRLR